MQGMNGMGKGLSPGMPPNIPNMQPVMQPGMPPNMPAGIMPGMPQTIQQGVPPVNPYSQPHTDANRNEDDLNKEADTINKFLNTINEVQLPISDRVISNICAQAGFSTSDPRLIRLMSLACEYLIIISANECHKIAKNSTDLQLSDVKKALEKINVNIHRPEYIVNTIESDQSNIDDNQMFDFMEESQIFD